MLIDLILNFRSNNNPLKAIPIKKEQPRRPRSVFETTPSTPSKIDIFISKDPNKLSNPNHSPFNMKESGQVGMRPRTSKTNNFLQEHSLNLGNNAGSRQRSNTGLNSKHSNLVKNQKRASVRPFKPPSRNMFQTAPSSGGGLYSNSSNYQRVQSGVKMNSGITDSTNPPNIVGSKMRGSLAMNSAMRGSIPLKATQKVGSMQINNRNEETMSIRSRVSRKRGSRMNTSVMSREKRLERYSKRADRRSRSPGGGIKIRFGESRKKKPLIARKIHSRSDVKATLNRSVEGRKKHNKRGVGDKLNQTAVEPGAPTLKTKKANIFGNFSGGGLGKAQKVIAKNSRSSKGMISVKPSKPVDEQDLNDLRNSFDTNTESSMMNSVSDISANVSVLSNITGRSRRRKRTRTQIFDDDNDVTLFIFVSCSFKFEHISYIIYRYHIFIL